MRDERLRDAGKPRGRHPHHRLTAALIRSLNRPGRHADGHGLYLLVDENGAKRWVWRGVIKGKRCDLGLGSVALVPLVEARAEAVRLKTAVWKGDDPRVERQRARRAVPTLMEAAREVHASHAETFRNAKHRAQWMTSLERYVFPTLGNRPVDGLDSADILRVLKPVWTAKPETARRLRQRLRVIFEWARASGFRPGNNPVDGITTVLPRHTMDQTHHAALAYAEVPAFIRTLRASDVGALTKLAFEFLILTAARTGEVLGATWDEVDVASRTWTVPKDRIKAGREHRVPLCDRCLEILEEARELGDGGNVVFPGRSTGRPLSNMVFLMLLRRLGRTDITAHGFRSAFRDWAEERTQTPRSVVEAALAHVVKNKTEAAYLRSDLFERRRVLMDAWAVFTAAQGA